LDVTRHYPPEKRGVFILKKGVIMPILTNTEVSKIIEDVNEKTAANIEWTHLLTYRKNTEGACTEIIGKGMQLVISDKGVYCRAYHPKVYDIDYINNDLMPKIAEIIHIEAIATLEPVEVLGETPEDIYEISKDLFLMRSKIHALYSSHLEGVSSLQDKLSDTLNEASQLLEKFAIDAGIYGNGKLLINSYDEDETQNYSVTVHFAIITSEGNVILRHGNGSSWSTNKNYLNKVSPGWEDQLAQQNVPIIRKQDVSTAIC
jgi:hypothetical protein